MKKRISSIIVIFVIIISALAVPTGAAAAEERISYTNNDAAYGGGTTNNYGSTTALGDNAYARFNVKVPKSGNYTISARMSSSTATSVTVTTDKTSIEAEVDTGGMSIGKEIELITVILNQGYNKITITNAPGAVVGISYLYVDKAPDAGIVDFSKKSGAFKKHIVPAIIEAEDFDYSSAVSRVGANVMNQSYRTDSPLKLIKDDLSMLVAMDREDSVQYTFEVREQGFYDVSVMAKYLGIIRLYFDDFKGYAEAELIGEEECSFGTVYLSEGTHCVRLVGGSDGLVVDKLRFKHSKENSDYYKPSDLTEGKKILIPKKEVIAEPNPIWKNIYVSAGGTEQGDGSRQNPYKTIQAAKNAARQLATSMQGDIVIHIEPGMYFINETIHFDVSDGGQNGYNIIYKGTDPENKPVISGGRKIEGWSKVDDNIWSAKADKDITVMRQLYINEFPATMARSKYVYKGSDFYHDPDSNYEVDGFYIKKKNFPTLSNTEDIDLLYNYSWQFDYFPAKAIVDEGDMWRIEYDQPYFDMYRKGAPSYSGLKSSISVHISNAPELIDEPGEFYYDKNTKTVYYYAFQEEDMSKAEVYTPQVDTLFDVAGNGIDKKVSNLCFDSLDFRHGAWNDIARTGMCNTQADGIVRWDETVKGKLPAELEVNFADHISVLNCDFINHGSTVLAMRDCVTNSKAEGNYFRDIAGTAILVGDTYSSEDNRTVDSISRNISIKNNVIRRTGLDFFGCIGIEVLYANSIDIMNNDIKDTSYTGISVGWGWGDAISNTLKCGEHMIADNRVDNTGLAVYDGGSIYTLSEMKGTYIQGNYITRNHDSGGIYLDDGSKNIVVRDNVIADSEGNAIFKGITITDIYNNYANFSDYTQYVPWMLGSDTKIVSERPRRTEGNHWGPEARELIEKAGLMPEYRHLLTKKNIEKPLWRSISIEKFDKKEFNSSTEFRMYGRDMMDGGEGIAYHDTDPNGPTVYSNGGIGDTVQGEWLKYKIKPKTPGKHKLYLSYSLAFSGNEANASSQSGVTIYVDGEKVCNDFMLESTGSWGAQRKVYVGDAELLNQEHEVMIEFSTGSFLFGSIYFENDIGSGNDTDYDDGILFKLPSK